MKKIFLLALLSLSVLGSYAQTHDKATNDTLSSAAPIEQWEYKPSMSTTPTNTPVREK